MSSDKEFYHLTTAVNKALNPMEAPLKTKHARSVIITTHRTKEAKSLWVVLTRQPLMENRFTAWKFCHLLHKVLREGHASVLKQSQTHKKLIMEMGKLWGHLQDGVGNCIQAYSKLLVTKLDFHEKNAIFPGTLTMNYRDVEKYAGNDINMYFQLCVEIFDYIDDIIEVQSKVFTSINTYRMSSMTPQGQCRLAPLITLIQDSNPLYDLMVRFMFRLHNELPSDILIGHRERFRELFTKLKFFYDNVRPLQYFADLIQVPHLPETAPNFTSKVDFGSYVPPVVLVQPDPEPVMDNLVDTSAPVDEPSISPMHMHDNDHASAAAAAATTFALENAVREKEIAVQELSTELHAIKNSYNAMEHQHKREVLQLRDEVSTLSNELQCAKQMCTSTQMMKEDLEMKLNHLMADKTVQEDEKVKASEEKFNKLKIMYTQIRDEHINLLRQQGELNKQLNKEKSDTVTLRKEIEELQAKTENLKTLEEQQQTLGAEKNDLEAKLRELQIENERLAAANESFKTTLQTVESQQKTDAKNLVAQTSVIENTIKDLEEHKAKVQELEVSNQNVQSQLELLSQEKTDLTNTITTLKEKLLELENTNHVESENLTTTSKELQKVSEELQQYKVQAISDLESHQAKVHELEEFNKTIQLQITLLTQEKTDLTKTISTLEQKLSELQSANHIESENLTAKSNELEKVSEELQQYKVKVLELENTLQEVQTTLQNEKENHSTTLITLKADSDEKINNINELSAKVTHQTESIQQLQQQLEEIKQQANEKDVNITKLTEEKLVLENEVQDLIQQNTNLEEKNNVIIAEKEVLFATERDNRIKYESQICALLHCVLKTINGISDNEFSDNNQQQYFEKSFQKCDDIRGLLDEIDIVYHSYEQDKSYVEAFTRKCILLSHHFLQLHEACIYISNTSTDIENGFELFNQMNSFHDPLMQLFNNLQESGKHDDVQKYSTAIKTKLQEIHALLQQLKKSTNPVDLGEMVEKELHEMDKAIEEAAGRFVEILSNARAKNDGIKLEVNEKILDACTTLLECIKLLIQKSKVLQEEIVSTGRGHKSVKEFYKRNSQWTEGLISASKSVARCANLLVEAADKAVTSETNKNFEIIVAAQEIAACTAQLVIASKVKAPRESKKLAELTQASRSVSQATGAVVATVKDCNQHLEQDLDVDVSKLTASQAKTMEMDIHVKVLELEQALQVERLRLASFRRKHYQNSEE